MSIWLVAIVLGQAGDAAKSSPGDLLVLIEAAPLVENEKTIATLPRGERLRVLEIRGENARVRYGTHREGWIATKHSLGVQQGLDYYTTRIQKNADAAEAYFMRALFWDAKGEREKQIADLDQAIGLRPKDGNYWSARGVARYKQGTHDRAIEDLDKAVEFGTTDWMAYKSRGGIWAWRKDYQRAHRDYAEAIRLNPKDCWTYFARGQTWEQLGDEEKALADYAEAIRNDPTEYSFYDRRSAIWLRRNRLDKATEEFSSAIEAHPHSELFRLRRGTLRVRLGDNKGALEDYEEAIRLDPKSPDGYLGRGAVFYATGKFKDAIRDFSDAIARCPKFQESRLPEMYRRRAKSYFALNDDENVVSDLSEAIRQNSSDDDALILRSLALWRLGRYAPSLKDLDEVIKLKPNEGAAHMTLANFLATCPDDKVRDGERALTSAKRACELTKWKSKTALKSLAFAQAELGEFAEAVKAIERAVDVSPKEKHAELRAYVELFRAGMAVRMEPEDWRSIE